MIIEHPSRDKLNRRKNSVPERYTKTVGNPMTEFDIIKPLKDLDVIAPFVREIRERILALQQTEYDKDTLHYLANRNLTGTEKPFEGDFSTDPTQIQQIKHLSNALYLAEQVFEQLPKLDLSSTDSINGFYLMRDQGDEASNLLLTISEEFAGVFQQEIAKIISCLSNINSIDVFSKITPASDTGQHQPSISQKTGLIIGNIIDQMKPVDGKLDFNLLTWVSGVLPTYIEALKTGIEITGIKAAVTLPNVDDKKIASVAHKKKEDVFNAIQSIYDTLSQIKDPYSLMTNLPGLFALPAHFKQLKPVLSDITQEVDHLDDAVQHLIHQYLAQLKYDILPNLFALVDKFETQLLLKPGRLSIPLMEQIKPLYEMLIQTTKNYLNVKFTDKAEQLLKLEDARFIELRLTPIHQQMDTSKKLLHQIELTLIALNAHVDNIITYDNVLAADSKDNLNKWFTLLQPYLKQLDTEYKQIMDEPQPVPVEATWYSTAQSWLGSWYKSPEQHPVLPENPVLPALAKIKLHLEQMKADQAFKLKCNEEHIQSVQIKANRVVFEYNKPGNVFNRSEKEALSHHHNLSNSIVFDNQEIITNPQELTADEAWDVYQWYENKLTNLTYAEQECDHLLTALKNNQNRNKTNPIAFQSDYVPCLLDNKKIQHQPNRLYLNIEGTMLNYEVLEPLSPTPCSLIKMTQTDPRTLTTTELNSRLGNHDGFIQHGDQFFYFDTIKLNPLPLEKSPIIKPLMDKLTADALRVVETDEADFKAIENEHIRAVCKLYLMSLDDAKTAGHRNCYVWNKAIKQLSYIDTNGQAQEEVTLTADNKRLLPFFIFNKRKAALLSDSFTTNEQEPSNYLNLTATNLKHIIKPISCELNAITGHITSIGGHHPGIIKTGSIPLNELGCDLTHIDSVTPLVPYMSRVFDKALERGHVHNTEESQCIRAYSSIQPYLIDAYKNDKRKNIHPFDKDVVNFLSGKVYKDASNPESRFSFADFKPQLLGLKTILSNEKKILKKRLEDFTPIENKPFVVEPRPIDAIYHQTFSPDVAKFMLSIDPIKRQLHESRKTVFRVKLALEHLDQYSKDPGYNGALLNNPDMNLQNEHYPWFYSYLAQLTKNLVENSPTTQVITAERLKTHLKQIQCYEENEIKRNTLITKSINTQSHQKDNSCDLSETAAFMHLIHAHHEFKGCLMEEKKKLEPGQLHLKIEDEHLRYTFLHYGKPHVGKIALSALKPLTHYNNQTKLNKKMLSKILTIAYEQRLSEIALNHASLSSDEALDLYQWYLAIQNNRSDLSTQDQTNLQKKLAFYEKQAETKQPELTIERKYIPKEDRTNYLIKHKKIEGIFTDLKQTIQTHFDQLSDSFKEELKPASSAIHLYGMQQPIPDELLKWLPVSAVQALKAGYSKVPFPDAGIPLPTTYILQNVASLIKSMSDTVLIESFKWVAPLIVQGKTPINAYLNSPQFTKPHSPHQVLAYKRLMNIVHYLEQIMNEMQKIQVTTQDESKLFRMNHLLISYLYAAEIYPLVDQLSADLHFAPFFRDILAQVKAWVKQATDQGEHYSALDQDDSPVKNRYALSLINVIKMLPERLSSSEKAYKDQLPALKASAEKTVANIEKICDDSQASLSYFRLFFDLPVIFELLNKLPEDVENFATKINKRIKGDLETAPPEILSKIIMEADRWETTFGAKPGTISEPLEKILNEFYKGLITPLVPDPDTRVRLLCDATLMKKRKANTNSRFLTAIKNLKVHDNDAKIMQDLIKETNIDAFKTNQDVTPEVDHCLSELHETYKKALPQFKKVLNGASVYIMPFNKAKERGLNDCFVWNNKTSELFYIDDKGQPNTQTGCDLYLKSIPVGEPITEDLLNQSIKSYVRGEGKTLLPMTVKKPTLIKQGDRYFIYENSTNAKWTCTELEAGVISKMDLDFNTSTLLHRNAKYHAMYAEITTKTGWIYPIQLKSAYNFMECLANKSEPRPSGSGNPLANACGSDANCVYLSENEIKHFITSNSNFVMHKHGVSLPYEVGCCCISLPAVPTKFEDLKLPYYYNAYYVQVKGVNDALYYIDRATKSIEKHSLLPEAKRAEQYKQKYHRAPKNEQISFESIMSKIRKNKLLLNTDLNRIQELIGHRYQPNFISNLDDFVPDLHNLNKLKELATKCEYEHVERHHTAQLAKKAETEQLRFLKTKQEKQDALHKEIKQTIYQEHFNKKVEDLCKENNELQNYTLETLTNVVKIKPNCIYINIKDDNTLDYKVIDPAGKEQKGSIELTALGFTAEKVPSLDDLRPHLQAILKITSAEHHTRPYSLSFEYQTRLRTAMLAASKTIINSAMESESKAIDSALNEIKDTFKKEHNDEYHKLNALNKALDDFTLYLNNAETLWSTKHSLFESEETIRRKRSTIEQLYDYATNKNDEVPERIKQIQAYLLEDGTLDQLMNYSSYDANSFAKLFQWVLRLFEAVGLYTPLVIQHVDKLLHTIEEPAVNPSQQSNCSRFFANPMRNQIKTRAHELKNNINKKDEPDSTEGNSKKPGV